MNRDLVFAVLALSVGGLATGAWACLPRRPLRADSGIAMEAAAWRRLWSPLAPAVLVLALLGGWLWQEPRKTDEWVEPVGTALAMIVLSIAARAGLRALRALRERADLPAMTVGIVRPRVVIAPRLRAVLDDRALAAVIAHEEAHARHHDPLRVWLAHFVTDLQWPLPGARARLREWYACLELARDEEARMRGIRGEDLATAIVRTARMHPGRPATAAAGLTDAGWALLRRIERLLSPARHSPARVRRSKVLLRIGAVALLTGALWGGARFGDHLVRAVPFVTAHDTGKGTSAESSR